MTKDCRAINAQTLPQEVKSLRAGDRILLSGIVFTARDAAHKRFIDLLDRGEPLPFQMKGATLFYAGPTPALNRPVGACGPTTASRMDPFTPRLLDLGLCATIGKGERCAKVAASIEKNGAVYLCAIGGAGALASCHITGCEVIAFEDLGCESVKRLTFENFPLLVGMDCQGGSIFFSKDRGKQYG